jgi:tetratricopeptide (TPR) repeat protein
MIIADSLMPNQPFIINQLANMYNELGYYSLSELSYLHCIKLAPSWKVSIGNLGAFYNRRHELKKSETYLLKALEIDSNYDIALYELVQVYLYQTTKDAQAKKLIDKMLSLDSNYTRAWLWKFNISLGAGNYIQAEQYYLKAFSIDSLDSYVWLAHGNLLYYYKKDYEGAEKAYLKSIDLDSIGLNPDAWNMIGEIRIGNKDYENAMYAYLKAVSIDTLNYASWLGLGNSTMMLNDLKKAEECYLYCSKIYPEASLAWYNLACLNIKFGNKDIALYYFEEALKKGYLDFNYFEKDTDLDGIRNDARYQKLIKKYKKKTVAN